MLNREACERRVYRLATLLTGNSRSAAGVITVVVDAQPDLSKLDSAHLDRLTVLRSREVRPGVLLDESISPPTAQALADLPSQQREAWVLARVYRIPLRELARAMDCSVTATQRHLEVADGAMQIALDGKAHQAAEALLAYSMSLDVPAFYRREQHRRRMLRRLLAALAVLLILAAIVAVAVWWDQS